ncbi:vesicle-fusing ATPase 1-like isoform X2 [Artemia franciscana]|uniref:vesicle-fusing ATPase 1-like isoform X2 n=1 Tax=Artemia franciscana TaxID=6661 RepID=UPI0032DA6A9C
MGLKLFKNIIPGTAQLEVSARTAFYGGVAQYYQSCVCNREKRIGEEIARGQELVSLTKNFSGADLEGLVKAAVSHAQERCGFTKENKIKTEVVATFKLKRKDFMDALDQDTKPIMK